MSAAHNSRRTLDVRSVWRIVGWGCLLLLPASAGSGQEPDKVITDVLTARVKQFFDNLNNASVRPFDAFNDLLQDGPLEDQSERLNAFVEEYDKLDDRYGRFLQAQLLQAKRVGNDLIFLTYLYECEELPVVWRFVYYRPPLDNVEPARWRVVRLSFDTRLEQLDTLPPGGL